MITILQIHPLSQKIQNPQTPNSKISQNECNESHIRDITDA